MEGRLQVTHGFSTLEDQHSPSNEYSGLISFRMDCCMSLLSNGLSRVFSSTTAQKHQFFDAQLSL